MFVEFAMISAGEGDLEIDRISYMHTSCLGFGSLIFGYRPEHGFKELMKLCEPVWQAVDGNLGISEQLVSFNVSILHCVFVVKAKPINNTCRLVAYQCENQLLLLLRGKQRVCSHQALGHN